jgi:alpha-tubulin suppressor-like RCC1 family protein
MSVFGWGSNKFGELCSNSVPIWEPMNINFFEGKSPIGIASGEGHSLVVTESGDVYSFGRGHDGQLGLGNIKANANLPQLVSGLQHECIVGVFTGAVSSYAVTTTGRAYQWYKIIY